MTSFATTKIGNRTRISNGFRFGQIHNEGRKWHAEIRESETGDLVRFAGIWNTKREAIEEVEMLLSLVEHQA